MSVLCPHCQAELPPETIQAAASEAGRRNLARRKENTGRPKKRRRCAECRKYYQGPKQEHVCEAEIK